MGRRVQGLGGGGQGGSALLPGRQPTPRGYDHLLSVCHAWLWLQASVTLAQSRWLALAGADGPSLQRLLFKVGALELARHTPHWLALL